MKNYYLLLLFLLMSYWSWGQIGREHIMLNCDPCKGAIYDVGDIDGNNTNDIVISVEKGLHYLLNDGNANFSSLHYIDSIAGSLNLKLIDIDLDGDNDIIRIRRNGIFEGRQSSIILYENNGNLTFTKKVLVDYQNESIRNLNYIDLDGDSDTDMVYYHYIQDRHYVIEQLINDGNGDFTAKTTQIEFPNEDRFSDNDLYFIEIADNALPNVVIRARSEILLYGSPSSEALFTEKSLLYSTPDSSGLGVTQVEIADLNGDGKKDIFFSTQLLYYSPSDRQISVFVSYNTQNGFSSPHLFNHIDRNSYQIYDADFDGDNDLINMSSSFGFFWYENDGNGNFLLRDINDPSFLNEYGSYYYLNNDTIPDFLFYRADNLHKSLGSIEEGTYKFSPFTTIFENVSAWRFIVSDFNQNQVNDLIIQDLTYGELVAYKNDGLGNVTVDSVLYRDENISEMYSVDINGDRVNDIVTVSSIFPFGHHQTIVHISENSSYKQIELDTFYFYKVVVADFNQDGFKDICGVANDTLRFYFNNANNNFSNSLAVSTQSFASYVTDFVTLDFDNNGSMDIVMFAGAMNNGDQDRIVGLPNDGNGDFGTAVDLTEIPPRLFGLLIIKIDSDSDGDDDFILKTHRSEELILYVNKGNGEFVSKTIVEYDEEPFSYTSQFEQIVRLVDYDNDGDQDLVTRNINNEYFYCVENLGANEFASPQNILSLRGRFTDFDLADLNRDRLPELIVRTGNKISWYGNYYLYPLVSGTIFYDINADEIQDVAEIPLQNIPIRISPSELQIFSDENGEYSFSAPKGTYNIEPQIDSCYTSTSSEIPRSVTIDTTSIINQNFGFNLDENQIHTQPRITSPRTRCGFTIDFRLSVENDGCSIPTGQYGIVLSPLVELLATEIEPTETRSDTLLWNYADLYPNQIKHLSLTMEIAGTDFLGDTIHLTGLSYIENDLGELELSGTYDYASEIRCAYDPNDKLVYPDRNAEYAKNYTLFGEQLEYTVRFQNTGTDTAFTVVIRDTLDTQLDWTTFRPVEASHKFTTQLSPNGLVEFTFADILLPDSTTNEPASHGFITYKIKPQEGLDENSDIRNFADIYFDFNPPIRTNTTSNVLVSEFPVTATQNVKNTALIPFAVTPNPTTGVVLFEPLVKNYTANYQIVITSTNGKEMLRSTQQKGRQQMDLSTLASGLYFYQIQTKNGGLIGSGKIVKQ